VKRICTKCGIEKFLSEFWNHKSGKFGKQCVCKECQRPSLREISRKNYLENKEYFEKYRQENREKINKYQRKRRKGNPNAKLSHNLRTRLNEVLRKRKKVGSAIKDLGCTVEELRRHLESQFQPGMSWDNHGIHGWHIDHIKPLASFDLTKRDQFLEAVHYTNLQPLWATDNWSKSNK
jgi:superfamily II helicase